ncbi:MAG: flavodoxin family protein [candidate division Zixibacteria bacterium]|nr:flavodoxin family protein [candidate division Zixibacteria bacterium]
MIKILSISASPVEGASTDIILRAAAAALTDNLQPELKVENYFIKLNELNYIPCQACGRAPTPAYCFFEDDLDDVYRLLVECDCILFGSPVYFDTVSAQAKMLIDRCNCFRPADFEHIDPDHAFIKLMKRKRPGAMVLVGGKQGWFEGARRTIAGFFKWLDITNQGHLIYHSEDYNKKGTAADEPEILSEARKLGEKLAGLILRKDERS